MPGKPFSGKMKKQQLQEKRERKRNKPTLGADTDNDSDDSTADNHYAHLHHGNDKKEEGGKADYKPKFQKGGGRGGGGAGRGDATPAADGANTANDIYGGDKKGVRSEFKKEHRREVKERQQANYAPLIERDFVNADHGIPFGNWFKVGNLAARRQFATVVDGVQLGEGGFSTTFLYSIALPHRARMSGEDGTDIFADPADDSDDYDQGPKGGRGGRGVGRGGAGGRGRGPKKGPAGGGPMPEFTDSTTTSSDDDDDDNNKGKASASSSSSSSEEDAEEDESVTTAPSASAADNTNTKVGLKALKDRLLAATAYDARERHVFRHWMNSIDKTFGVAHDGKQQQQQEQDDQGHLEQEDAEEEEEGAAQKRDGEDDLPDKERRFGRRHRAVDKANAAKHDGPPPPPQQHPLAHLELNLFERNIDVWRQLWRTVENSDVVVAVADARYPIVHLPISLFMHAIGECGKPVVVVLNKVDLVKAAMIERWERFLRDYWSRTLKPLLPEDKHALVDGIVICRFTCSPEAGTALAKGDEKATSRRKKKAPRNAKLYEELKSGESKKGQSSYAPSRKEMKGKRFDYAGDAKRDAKKDSDASGSDDDDSDSDDDDKAPIRQELVIVKGMIDAILAACRRKGLGLPCRSNLHAGSTAEEEHHPLPAPSADVKPVHIGFVGHPNVGKSSLINCIRGSKVVSVSSTAGHTKHLQTVPLLADGVVLIDCPGLAFPVLGLPRPMQAVLGTHQIAQTRDPQSGIGYLAARLQLERIYGLRKLNSSPNDADHNEPWSAYDICESYGHKKGFHVKKGKGAIDVHRAAIALLSEAYDGRLVLAFAPPPTTPPYLTSPAFTDVVRQYLYLDPEWIAASLEKRKKSSNTEEEE